MRKPRLFVVASLALALPFGCAPAREQTRPTAPVASTAAPSPDEGGDAAGAPAEKAPRREVRLLFTTDEHGWLRPLEDEEAKVERGGLVTLAERLRKEGLGQPHVALISVGDMWTGPYETTVLEGEPMVAAMNHLGYRATVVGNHEFDFGLRVLERRQSEARFPFLAANLREAATGRSPSWAKPSALLEVGGVRFGVVGLANTDTPLVTDPRHLAGLEFLPYADTLREEVPKLRAAGAEQILVLLHDRIAVANELTGLLRELGVHVVGVGHAHNSGMRIDPGETPDDKGDDVVLCNGGAYMRSYCRIDLAFEGNDLVDRAVNVLPVEKPVGAAVQDPDPVLTKIVEDADARANKLGREVLVAAPKTITRKSGALAQLVVDSWVEALPYVDAALTNAGGLRQDLRRGDVAVRDVVSVMPFNNYLLVVDLTGAQLKEALENPEAVAAGVRFTYRQQKDGSRVIESLLDKQGKPIDPARKLRVVVNDFMYRGGDSFRFKEHDPEPEETALDWREPLFRKLRTLGGAKKKLEVTADDRAKKVQ